MIKKLIERFWRRDIITYLIAGVATTLVNFLVSYIMFNLLGIDENITNITAWVIAVAFAYVVNAYWVFEHRYVSARDELAKIGKFVLARVFTLIVEEGSILILCTMNGVNFWLVKIPANIVVIILNYVFSKMMIFVSGKRKEV